MQSSHFAWGPCLGASEDMRRQCARGFVELQGQLAIAYFPRNGNNPNHDIDIKSNKHKL